MLRNIVVLNDGEEVTPEMLPQTLTAPARRPDSEIRPPGLSEAAHQPPYEPGEVKDMARLAELIRPLAEVEWDAIEHAVALCGGDVRKAAVFLGIGPATIYRKRSLRRAEDKKGAD